MPLSSPPELSAGQNQCLSKFKNEHKGAGMAESAIAACIQFD